MANNFRPEGMSNEEWEASQRKKDNTTTPVAPPRAPQPPNTSGVNPTATNRAARAEDVTARPKGGSTNSQRHGMDPDYHASPDAAGGVQNLNNSINPETGKTPDSRWSSLFPHVDALAAPTPLGAASQAAGTIGGIPAPAAMSPAPVYGSGIWPAPKVEWSGPSLMPRLGPPREPSSLPDHTGQTFTLPPPVTSPTGNAATDAANLAANAAMAAPGGAAGFWHGGTAPVAPEQWHTPIDGLAAAAASGPVNVPGGSVAVHYVPRGTIDGPLVGDQSTGPKHAPGVGMDPIDWAGLADPGHLSGGNGPTQIPLGTPPVPAGGAQPPIMPPTGPVPGVAQPKANAKINPNPDEDEEGNENKSANDSEGTIDPYS
jgi:hypothetical protein